jgi:hypothetical protein
MLRNVAYCDCGGAILGDITTPPLARLAIFEGGGAGKFIVLVASLFVRQLVELGIHRFLLQMFS